MKTLLWRLVSKVLGLVVVLWVLSVTCVVLWGNRNSTGQADAIVVMGAAQYAGRPSPVLRARLDHAYDLWKQDTSRGVILTGGRGDGDTTSEAEVGLGYLAKRGVPKRSMMLEKHGRSSEESLDAVADLVRDRELKRVILVSDPFHMFRLEVLSWQRDIDAVSSPTRTSPIAANRAEMAVRVLGESVKVIASLLPAAWRKAIG